MALWRWREDQANGDVTPLRPTGHHAQKQETQMTYAQAAAILKAKGMVKMGDSPYSDQKREYWGYPDKPNKFYDHSATITRIGRDWHLAA